MKLSNQQINSIVSAAQSSANDLIKNEKESLRKDKKIVVEAKRIFSIMNKIPKEFRRAYYGSNNLEDIIEQLIKDIPLKNKEIRRGDLYDKIVLASIDAKDLNELKKSLKLNF